MRWSILYGLFKNWVLLSPRAKVNWQEMRLLTNIKGKVEQTEYWDIN
jgi:hypothetical protein